MAMWLTKPFYEALPFVYMVAGLASLGMSLWLDAGAWSLVLAVFGFVALTGGLVILLKRYGYRSSRSRTAFDEQT